MRFQLESGENATAIHFENNRLDIQTSHAYAPGASVRGLLWLKDATPIPIDGRVIAVKRDTQLFAIGLRLVGLKKEHRKELIDAMS